MRKCINCVWEGEDAVLPYNHCPVCGDNTKSVEGSKSKPKLCSTVQHLDLNNDGVIDKKDATIAGKVLRKIRSKKSKR